MFKRFVRLFLPAIAIGCISAGCGHKDLAQARLAPEKPLSQSEEALLKQIEDTPEKDRNAFMSQHRSELMTYSMGNKTFGDRLNVVLGVQPQAGSK